MKSLNLVDSKTKLLQDILIHSHSSRVAYYSKILGEYINLNDTELTVLQISAKMHDIGKLRIPIALLNKREKLTDAEFEVIKQHTIHSSDILIEKGMGEFADIVKHHHERWDGKGYPNGLAGDAIPYFSRVIAIADAYDAMISIRPYGRVYTNKDALVELLRSSGTQFDPNLVPLFIQAIEYDTNQKTHSA